MTTEELEGLPIGTKIYLATDWDVQVWQFEGQLQNGNYYTLTHPPDADGVVSNRRPIYMHALDMQHASQDELTAWESVRDGLFERVITVTEKISHLNLAAEQHEQ